MLFLLLAAALLPLAASAATNSDAEFRQCMRDASRRREDRIVDAARAFHHDWQNLLHERRDRIHDAWDIVDDKGRRAVLRDIDRDIRNRLRDRDRGYRNDLKAFQRDFTADGRRCRDEWKARERDRENVPVGEQCFHSGDCAPPAGICSTDFGDCRPACRHGSSPCIQVCSGVCVIR